MSVYVVEKQTIDEIVAGLVTYGLVTPELAQHAGQTLTAENVRSVEYRYAEPKHIEPEYERTPVACTIGQLARSVTNFCYQANEHPGWTTSESRAMCFRLAFALLAEIPGYHEAEAR